MYTWFPNFPISTLVPFFLSFVSSLIFPLPFSCLTLLSSIFLSLIFCLFVVILISADCDNIKLLSEKKIHHRL